MPTLFGRPAGWLCVVCLGCQAPGSDAEERPFDVEVVSVAVCDGSAAGAKGGGPKSTEAVSTLGVKMRVTGRYQDRVPANYFYASLLARDGTRYLPTSTGCRPLLAGSPLLPGETREGYANFPMAAQKGAQRLAYAPNLERTRGIEGLAPSSLTVEVPLP